MTSDAFLNPRCRISNLHDYRLRRDILAALRRELPRFEGVLLDVGCGQSPYKSVVLSKPGRVSKYIGLDLPTSRGAPDIMFADGKIPLADASIDTAMATEVLEHCPDPAQLLAEISRVLKPGGVFFLTVPFVWPLHEVPNDQFRYTPFAMERLLKDADFEDIGLAAHAGWDGTLAQMLGLWVTYRGMRPWKRRLLAHGLRPIISLLNSWDEKPAGFGHEGCMLTGFSGTARRRRNLSREGK